MADKGKDKEQVNQLKQAINQTLIDAGEKEKLKDLLRQKLLEHGWRDKLKAHCKEVVKSKGIEQITVEELVKDITPQGRGKKMNQLCGLMRAIF